MKIDEVDILDANYSLEFKARVIANRLYAI